LTLYIIKTEAQIFTTKLHQTLNHVNPLIKASFAFLLYGFYFPYLFSNFCGKEKQNQQSPSQFFENQFVFFFFYIKKRRKKTMLNITKSSFGVYIELANSRSGPGSRRAPF
jgi:hypothetical protein